MDERLASVTGKRQLAKVVKFTRLPFAMNMHITVSATEANRNFAKLLREVGRGVRITVTSHGTPVAEISPTKDEVAARERRLSALAALQKDWAEQPHITIGPWTRDDLYDRDW